MLKPIKKISKNAKNCTKKANNFEKSVQNPKSYHTCKKNSTDGVHRVRRFSFSVPVMRAIMQPKMPSCCHECYHFVIKTTLFSWMLSCRYECCNFTMNAIILPWMLSYCHKCYHDAVNAIIPPWMLSFCQNVTMLSWKLSCCHEC